MKLPTHLDVAKTNMPMLGQLLVRKRYGDFWEDETRTLPWTMRRLRREYREFSEKHIKPIALQVDKDPTSFDKDKLFLEYAKRGWATELLPPPIGSLKWGAVRHYGFNLVLKIEEMFAACGGISLFLGAHDLGFMPLVTIGSWDIFNRWVRRRFRLLCQHTAA